MPPFLRAVIGEERDIQSNPMKTALQSSNSDFLRQRLHLIHVFTKAIVYSLIKTKRMELNTKEMHRKSLVGMPSSPAWKTIYKELLHIKNKDGRFQIFFGILSRDAKVKFTDMSIAPRSVSR